jgi:hypothetical protein
MVAANKFASPNIGALVNLCGSRSAPTPSAAEFLDYPPTCDLMNLSETGLLKTIDLHPMFLLDFQIEEKCDDNRRVIYTIHSPPGQKKDC